MNKEVIEIYDKQLRDITAIAETQWFIEICKYWERIRDTALENLKIVDWDNLKIRQLEYYMANNFLTFLKRLLIAREIDIIAKS